MHGPEQLDDAGVIRIDERRSLVQTIDFFPPIVDEPRDFGRIAAANALSDVYAMGGTPLSALNVVGFPRKTLDMSVLAEILAGGSEKIAESGAGASTFSDWWAYKIEAFDAIPYNSALMTRAGVVTSIDSDDAEMVRRLNQEAAKQSRREVAMFAKMRDLRNRQSWSRDLMPLSPERPLSPHVTYM